MRFESIASGSSGNCIYVGTEETHVLIDAGISGRRVEEGLRQADLCGKDIKGIFVTHEHIDHIQGLGVLARRYHIPIFATEGTIEGIMETRSIGSIDPELFCMLRKDEDFQLGDLKVHPFEISHDAKEPCGYTLTDGVKKVAVATDMGTFTPYTVEQLQNLNAILLEANHDVRMLQTGPYHYLLKQRILSDQGHLSNENSGRLLSRLLSSGMEYIFLGHLSKENNLPELAYASVRLEIDMSDTPYRAADFDIRVAARDICSEVLTV
ncbi:MAG: MBL fold metallo-hydrolase [Lachnospiraceae bacterium]|nr:MBL fold metallo-hydrolase [Lachnospiraceae bacterium]